MHLSNLILSHKVTSVLSPVGPTSKKIKLHHLRQDEVFADHDQKSWSMGTHSLCMHVTLSGPSNICTVQRMQRFTCADLWRRGPGWYKNNSVHIMQ